MKISLEEAGRLLKKNIIPMAAETVPIWNALGRTTAENIDAREDYPPFDRSPYDGYAVMASCTGTGRKFKIVGASFAGNPCNKAISEFEAVRIMTGGVIPEGADCVVPQEETDNDGDYVKISRKFNSGDNYIHRGEDFIKGKTIIGKNTKITASHMALAAAGGWDYIKMFRKIKTAVISTGDELTDPGEKLKYGCIYDTNLIYITMRLNELGMVPSIKISINDDLGKLAAAIKYACDSADMVILTGGVSVGERDIVPEALEKAKASIKFHGVDIKPGMPTLFAMAEVPVIGLSGNPLAAAVGFEVIARPALAFLSGNKCLLPKIGEGILETNFDKISGTRRFVKASVKEGRVSIMPQGNGSIMAADGSSCFIDILSGSMGLRAGSRVKIIYA